MHKCSGRLLAFEKFVQDVDIFVLDYQVENFVLLRKVLVGYEGPSETVFFGAFHYKIENLGAENEPRGLYAVIDDAADEAAAEFLPFALVVAEALGGYFAAVRAVGPVHGVNRDDIKLVLYLGEQVVSIIGAIVGPNACTITTEHVEREAEVGPLCGVKNGFLRTGVAHIPESQRGEVVMIAEIALFPQLALGQDGSPHRCSRLCASRR